MGAALCAGTLMIDWSRQLWARCNALQTAMAETNGASPRLVKQKIGIFFPLSIFPVNQVTSNRPVQCSQGPGEPSDPHVTHSRYA